MSRPDKASVNIGLFSALTVRDLIPSSSTSNDQAIDLQFFIFFIAFLDRPEHPASGPYVSQLTPSSLVLSWSGPSYDGGSPITEYIVEMQSFGPSESTDWSVLTSKCKDTTYQVRSGLQSQGEYRFRVRACNAVGVSDPSEESDCIRMDTAGTH